MERNERIFTDPSGPEWELFLEVEPGSVNRLVNLSVIPGAFVVLPHGDTYGPYGKDDNDAKQEVEPSLEDALDMKLTPYTGTVTLGDHTFPVGEYRMHPNWAKMEDRAVDPSPGGGPVTTADLDAYDHYISDEKIHAFRELHPTQEDRIEKKLDEIIHQLSPVVNNGPEYPERVNLAYLRGARELELPYGRWTLEGSGSKSRVVRTD